MDDWFKGTYCGTELIESSVGDIVNDSAQAFVRLGSTNAYMRVIGCGEGRLK